MKMTGTFFIFAKRLIVPIQSIFQGSLMFPSSIYQKRRDELKQRLGSGVILIPGNEESPMNYPANTYDFRQDSTFLYYFGIDLPGLAGIIDIDDNRETLFGNDHSPEDTVWAGPQESVANKALSAGIDRSLPPGKLTGELFRAAAAGQIHFLPQYRVENQVRIAAWCGLDDPGQVGKKASIDLVKAVAAQRTLKCAEEIAEIEAALDISYEMYDLADKIVKPGIFEYEVSGAVDGIRSAKGSASPFSTICTVHGEVLHGTSHHTMIRSGDLLLLDSGADSPNHYASDITRTFPVGREMTSLQKDIYNLVLGAQTGAIAMMKPGVTFRNVHLQASKIIAHGMKRLGFMKGDYDAAVEAGAHALFFPHGLGHLLGLDVHDMQGLGEDHIGYDESIKRSEQFGLSNLRFAKCLEPGMVLTVEPGIYCIPSLIAQWRECNRFVEFIDYSAIEKHFHFTGIRIEDDVLVTEQGSRILGKPIPK
jgi:Xaa-Pro aminopeptidase